MRKACRTAEETPLPSSGTAPSAASIVVGSATPRPSPESAIGVSDCAPVAMVVVAPKANPGASRALHDRDPSRIQAATERELVMTKARRADLQRHHLGVPGREVIQNRVDIGPEAPAIKHEHPGEEIIYVLEGSLEYSSKARPPRRRSTRVMSCSFPPRRFTP
jgi:hypothetical protein